MNDAAAIRPPIWFWAVALLALAWMGFLCFSYLTVIRSPGTPVPAWISALFAITAFGGLVGALLMLARRRWALWPLLASLLAALVQHGSFFLAVPVQLLGWQTMAIPAAVLILGFVFVATARVGSARGWLR